MKPCPFCASENLRIEKQSVAGVASPIAHMEYVVLCRNCGAFGPNDLSENSAVEMWDLRRLESAQQSVQSDLRHACGECGEELQIVRPGKYQCVNPKCGASR